MSISLDHRKHDGLMLAATCKIKKVKESWIIPSQTGVGKYEVILDKQPKCNCPDFEVNGELCKHIHAAQIVHDREYEDEEKPIVSPQEPSQRKSYTQDWPAYNRAQINEKATFQSLLHDLCQSIPESDEPPTRGNPKIRISDAIFVACFKVYSMMSGRRFISDLCDAHAKGYISRVPHFNSIFNVFNAEETYGILKTLIGRIAAPLKALETNFAVDSTGFSGSKFERWFDEKWGEAKSKRSWVKAHAMVGINTNVITAVEVLEKHSGDGPQLIPLMHETQRQFVINDLSADMAYLSESNLNAIVEAGAKPLIPFKTNSRETHPGIWNKMYHYYHFKRDEFLARYHKRSNIESTFSMLKRKFGDGIRSKTDLAMRNEVMAKIVCHNICCVIQSMEEFGITPEFD